MNEPSELRHAVVDWLAFLGSPAPGSGPSLRGHVHLATA